MESCLFLSHPSLPPFLYPSLFFSFLPTFLVLRNRTKALHMVNTFSYSLYIPPTHGVLFQACSFSLLDSKVSSFGIFCLQVTKTQFKWALVAEHLLVHLVGLGWEKFKEPEVNCFQLLISNLHVVGILEIFVVLNCCMS